MKLQDDHNCTNMNPFGSPRKGLQVSQTQKNQPCWNGASRRRRGNIGTTIDSYEAATDFLRGFRAFTSRSLEVIHEGIYDDSEKESMNDLEDLSSTMASTHLGRLSKTQTSSALSSLGGSTSSLSISLAENQSHSSLIDFDCGDTSDHHGQEDDWGFYTEDEMDEGLGMATKRPSKIFVDTRPRLR